MNLSQVDGFLVSLGLKFQDEVDEETFAESYCLGRKRLLQVALILGSVITYVFFVWDQVVDPTHAQATQEIRGLFLVPLLWGTAAALSWIKKPVALERLLVLVGVIFAGTLAVLFHLLSRGFDYGVAGELQFLLFVFCLIPARSLSILFVSLFTWASFFAIEITTPGLNPGLLLLFNLLLGSTIVFGMFSVVTREVAVRREYATSGKLRITEHELGKVSETNELLRKATQRLLDAAAVNLFISYRRADSEAIAGRIRDRLVNRFGEASVFMDIDSLPFGLDFREQIGLAARRTDAALAIIGPSWRGKVAKGKPRIWEPSDPVRGELESALQRSIPIIPVLVLGATMPTPEDLPASLRELSFRNAIQIDAGRDFHPHMDRLIRAIDAILSSKHSQPHDG